MYTNDLINEMTLGLSQPRSLQRRSLLQVPSPMFSLRAAAFGWFLHPKKHQ